MNNSKNKILFMITFMSLCVSSFSSQAMYNDRDDRSRYTGRVLMNDARNITGNGGPKILTGINESEQQKWLNGGMIGTAPTPTEAKQKPTKK